MSPRYRVGLRSYQLIALVCVLFFGACSAGAMLAGQYGPIPIFVLFAAMGVYILVAAGAYSIDDEAVEHQCLLGHFRIRWDEVTRIEVGTQSTLVLHGHDKRFVLAPPNYWSGTQKSQAFDLVRGKLDAQAWPAIQNMAADYKIHKNVRVTKA